MSLTHRLAAVLPAAGVTVLAALALAGSPAAATADTAARQPAVLTTPCADGQRGQKCNYGTAPAETPADGSGAATPGGGPTRGQAGYGTVSPTASEKPTPTASVNTVTPGGEKPATSTPGKQSSGGGVSAGGGTLPLTGAPLGLTISLGGALVAAGAGAVLYSRRRRSA